MADPVSFKPFVSDEQTVPEFTPKAVVIGALFGLIFGASNVYLALKAGLTVSASIPIAVLAISLLKKLGGSTILENNIVQTIGSAGESIASGVVFTLPGFLFLATDPVTGVSVGTAYFSYWTIFTLALLGGVLGTLMMIPLRRALIVGEHGTLPYPEGTACAQVLVAGERGGEFAKTAYAGLGFSLVYAFLQKVVGVIAETPTWVSDAKSKVFPAATINADITPEYMGVGYILGLKNSALLAAGGVMAWLGLIPLLATLVPQTDIAQQLTKLGYHPAKYGYSQETHEFVALNSAVYFAYVRQIGAGAVAAGGFITLLKTIPTIVSSFRGSLASLRGGSKGSVATMRRTERDLPLWIVGAGSLGLIVIVAFLPFIPGTSFGSKLLLGTIMVLFGFFFVTVSSRIVGIIGASSNPVSGMTIATLMATCVLFIAFGWTGNAYQPMALCVGGMVCIAAANAGATSQDLKTGFLVGATPRAQQVGLLIGAVAAAFVIGITVNVLDNAHVDPATGVVVHAIGDKFPAPQGTLMATLIKGLLAHDLDWQFVLVGVAIAATMEMCGVRSLAFAVGAYLPLSTTLPIFVGGVLRHFAEMHRKAKARAAGVEGAEAGAADEELGSGNLFSTGLVAGGALGGVIYAMFAARMEDALAKVNYAERISASIGSGGFALLGVGFFALMGAVLYRVAVREMPKVG